MKNKSIIFLLIAFFFIFAGFDSSQQYLSSIFHTKNFEMVSFIALSILYISAIPSNILAPGICRKFGLKKSLFFASLAYPLFIITIVLGSEILLYISSCVVGIASSIFWVSHGTYFTKSVTKKNQGFYSGLSFSLLVVGSSITVFFMSFFVEHFSYTKIYFVLFILACLGSLSILFISNIDSVEKHTIHPSKLIKNKSMLLFSCFIFSNFFIVGSMISRIPIRITDLFGLSYVGKIISIFGITIAILTILIGRLSDRNGRRKFFYISILSAILGFIIILTSESVLSFSVGIFFLGFAHSSFLAIQYPVLYSLFEKEIDSAMAVKGIFTCFGFILPLILSMFFGFHLIVTIGIIFSVFSLLAVNKLFSIESEKIK